MPEGTNPFVNIKRFDEPVRESFLDDYEYVRVNQVLTAFENEKKISI